MTSVEFRRVAGQAAAEFGLGPVIALSDRLPEAWSNHVFTLRTRTGAYALKVFPPDLDPAGVERLRRGMNFESTVLATNQVPMARPVPDSTGNWLVRLDSVHVRCHAWLDGVPCSAIAPGAVPMSDIGRSVGVVQRVAPRAGDTSALPTVRLDRWQAALDRAATYRWGVDMVALDPLVRELIGEYDRLRDRRRPMFFGHRDLDPKNAVVRPDGRVALTDWDGAGPILPAAELVTAAVSFAGGPERADRALVEEFVAAYRAASGWTGVPDPIAMSIPALLDIEWLMDIVEGMDPADSAPPQPLPGFAEGVEAMRSWAETIGRL